MPASNKACAGVGLSKMQEAAAAAFPAFLRTSRRDGGGVVASVERQRLELPAQRRLDLRLHLQEDDKAEREEDEDPEESKDNHLHKAHAESMANEGR